MGNTSSEALVYYSLARDFESLDQLPKAVSYYEASVTAYNHMRRLLKSEDEWKSTFRNQVQEVYTGLWRILLKQGRIVEALSAAEKGRAQALSDLMETTFGDGASQSDPDDRDLAMLRYIPSNTVFLAVHYPAIILWVLFEEEQVQFRLNKVDHTSLNDVTQSFELLVQSAYTQIGVRANVRCENRSLHALRESRFKVDDKSEEESRQPPIQEGNCLSTLYNIIIQPIADLIEGDELIIVPDGNLWLAPTLHSWIRILNSCVNLSGSG